jgi:hypothetical protein
MQLTYDTLIRRSIDAMPTQAASRKPASKSTEGIRCHDVEAFSKRGCGHTAFGQAQAGWKRKEWSADPELRISLVRQVKELSDFLTTRIAPDRKRLGAEILEPEHAGIGSARWHHTVTGERAWETDARSPRVITTFQGTVDRIENDLAYVTFTEQELGQSFATLDADLLAECGIGEHDDFAGIVKRHRGQVVISYALLPRRALTDEQLQRIREKADELRDDDFGSS